MDRIPLINPKLVKVSSTIEKAPAPILRAEVVSSTPIKEQVKEQTENQSKDTTKTNSQEYKIVLKIGQQQLETLSNIELKKGSQIEVKVLPGPELKIINSDQKSALIPTTATPPATSTPQANALVQQLLADRIPNIQQQDLPQLIKQLSQIINRPADSQPATKGSTSLSSLELSAAGLKPIETKPTTQQSLANQLYQQQGKSIPADTKINSPQLSISNNTLSNTTASNTKLLQVKTWLQQLPQSQDIITSTGLRNAFNNAGIQAEAQLSNLAQQSLNVSNKSNANSIFQQLQKLQQGLKQELQQQLAPEPAQTKDPSQAKKQAPIKNQPIDLSSIVKRTAKVLSDNTQSVLSGLMKSTASPTQASPTQASTVQTSSTQAATALSTATPVLIPSSWQNPQLNSSFMNLDELLQAPLLQNPSSNNKFALSQILTNQGQQDDTQLRTPLNWPERTGNDAVLIRNLQNLLGHIEREQVQQMQLAEANQSNNPNQLQQSQQWFPLLINHQQQLQLIEFYIDKEERLSQAGEKKNHWFINLHFDLPKLGKLGIEIAMLDNECNTTFWSESPAALNQLSQHIQPLRQRLTEQGIVVSDIQSRHGTLEKRKHNIQQRLVDVRT
jgi:hypothetical protein